MKITDSNPLFDAYLNDFDAVKKFYQFNYESDWEKIIDKRSQETFDRQRIYDILIRQNEEWDAPSPVLENISKLKSENGFAVITGQQAGVFGGPLYTIYKIITTLKLTDRLDEEYPDYDFVPCFWMEVDDHDFEEINHIHFFNKQNELRHLELSEDSGDALKPIHLRQLNSEISAWKAVFEEEFHPTEFLDDILEMFFNAYSAPQTYADAFARLILRLFGEQGLVVVNPADPEMKELGQGLFQKVLEEPAHIQKQLEERNRSLKQSGLPQQIQFQPDQTLLFYVDDGNRRVRINADKNGDFLLKYKIGGEKLARSTLMNIIEEAPQRFSANVALRPLLQDAILPTVGYVAGPAEVAYFAQISTLYRYFDQTMPIIYPRHRLTIIESKIQRLIDKLEIDAEELFQHRSDYAEVFIRQKQNAAVFGEIENIREEISNQLKRLQEIVAETDPPLVNAIEKTEQKTRSNIEQVVGKITNSLKQKEATEMEQLKRTLLFLFPDDNFQERVINIIYFLIKYGPDFTVNLYRELPLHTGPHYLVYL